MKAPRFITEYANHKKRNLKENIFIQEKFRKEMNDTIDWAVKSYERGMITTDETMQLIAKC